MHREFLPSTIYLQLDNTAKENKNQFVFTFFAYLVQTKVFERVCILKSTIIYTSITALLNGETKHGDNLNTLVKTV